MSDKTATLRQRLRQTAAEAMLDSAERAMLHKSYERATMAEIAEAAGCATGTFYLYFKNKEELLQAIVARHTKAIFDVSRAAMDEVDDPMEKLRRSAAAHLRYIHDHRGFFRMLFTAIPMGHRSLHQRLSGASRQLHDDYTRFELEIIRRGQKQGKVRFDVFGRTVAGVHDVGRFRDGGAFHLFARSALVAAAIRCCGGWSQRRSERRMGTTRLLLIAIVLGAVLGGCNAPQIRRDAGDRALPRRSWRGRSRCWM